MTSIYKRTIYLLVMFFLLSCSGKTTERKASNTEPSLFTKDIKTYYQKTLDSTFFYMHKIDTVNTLETNQKYFIESRKWYKHLEPLLIAYDYENYVSINAPNLLKVEMEDYTEIKKLQPKSFQVLEEYLFGDEKINNKELYKVYSYLSARLPFVKKNHMLHAQMDRHHLKMIRDVIVNIATKGITGFDSPMLANSLQEAVYNYKAIEAVLTIYKEAFNNKKIFKMWSHEIEATIATLTSGDFDTFDRYHFIKNHTNKQLELVTITALDWRVVLNTSSELNPTAENLFGKNFFNTEKFALPNSPKATPARIALGKQLFNDKSLSKDNTMSCATCHNQEKAFTDGFAKGIGKNGVTLQRNTPTLTYALFQKSFFYDGRSAGLEDQIVSVANNKNEFHTNLSVMKARVKANTAYQIQFDSLYDGKINSYNIRNAMATYIRSLAPFNSKFDRNMQGLESTLSNEEKEGFNLFMGKAACATCHFPPTFNGTVPPKFLETEFENLGITATADFTTPILDKDPGQYHPYQVEERRGFFKTSTVRNSEVTAPYMHNGAYATLEEVMDFYNFGGGQGMGLDVPYQTLTADSLQLKTKEIGAIIAFLKTLTDKDYVSK